MGKHIPFCKGEYYIELLEQLSESGTLVDIILSSNPIGFDLPKEIEDRTVGVRILNVGEDFLVVGPKKPLITAIIPLDEVVMVMISDQPFRQDEDELDLMIAELYSDLDVDYGKTSRIDNTNIMTECTDESDTQDYWDLIDESDIAVVDVYATWCAPCKSVSLIMDELKEQYGRKIEFLKIDGEDNEDLEEEFDIQAYPTVLILKKGDLWKKIVGAREIEFYKNQIEILLGHKKNPILKNRLANGNLNQIPANELLEIIEEIPFSTIVFIEKGNHECHQQTRVLRDLAKQYKNKVFFAKLDVDQDEELIETFEIEHFPTVFFVANGEGYSYYEERLTKVECREEIEEMIQSYL